MTLLLEIKNGRVELPEGVTLPDGTLLQAHVLPSRAASDNPTQPIKLPTFRGNGVQPGVDLHDNVAIRRILDEPGKFSQF